MHAQSLNPLRFARWVGALALVLAPAWARAQDGQPPVGPPVTNPKTDKLLPREETSAPRPRTSADVLPPVPATAADPAPPGTRAVRVDDLRGAPAGPGTAAQAAPGARPVPGVMVAEGVVTRIDPPGKNVAGELLRFAFDPAQDWSSYISLGPSAAPPKEKQTEAKREKTVRKSLGSTKPDERIKQEAAKEAEDAADEADKDNEAKADAGDLPAVPAPENDATNAVRPNRSRPIEMVVTRRTYIFSHARSPEGADLFGVATQSSPDINNSRTGLTRRSLAPVPGPLSTNFTNIKEGSFVSVRYRRIGKLNEVLNLNLIEHPMGRPDGNAPAAGAPAPTGGTAPVLPGQPATSAIPGAPATPAAPVRVPRIPTNPVGPGNLPR